MPGPTTSRLGAMSGIAYVLGILSLDSLKRDGDIVLGAEVMALLLFVPFLAYLCGRLRVPMHPTAGSWSPRCAPGSWRSP